MFLKDFNSFGLPFSVRSQAESLTKEELAPPFYTRHVGKAQYRGLSWGGDAAPSRLVPALVRWGGRWDSQQSQTVGK